MKWRHTLPWSATASIFTLSSFAMKPITEKMTKPANILVALLVHVTISVSLERKHKKGRFCMHFKTLTWHMHPVGTPTKRNFNTYPIFLTLVWDDGSLETTRIQLCKFSWLIHHVGSHRLNGRLNISASGITKDSSSDVTECFNSA